MVSLVIDRPACRGTVAKTSRAPSYFSRFFEKELRKSEAGGRAVRTVYIDRDPETFKDIALHLQGYHIKPKNGLHYVRLFADAQFYGRMSTESPACILSVAHSIQYLG